MHVAVLSDPNNFHTQKWSAALRGAGARVTVFSYDPPLGDPEGTVTLSPPLALSGRYSYLAYLRGGKRLAEALEQHQVDLVNALNVTPFGVWAGKSGFHPLIQSALGADILEYPLPGQGSPALDQRAWAHADASPGTLQRNKQRMLRRFYRRQVAAALTAGDVVTGDNQHLIDCMRDWFGVEEKKLRLLRWGVEEALFQVDPARVEALLRRLDLRPDRKLILSPRGAKAIYQADIIFEAFRQLLQDGRQDVQCLMLSAGYEIGTDLGRKAREWAARDDRFRFVEDVLPREEVYALWNAVDIFVSAPIYDGYSASVAEGRYAGAVPVLNDIPANRELFSHLENAWICDPFRPGQLAADLKKILNRLPALKEKFGRVNREWVREHSLVERNAEKFMSWSEELVSQRK